MAKRLIDWNMNRSILEMGRYIDSDTPAELLESFDLNLLFPPTADFLAHTVLDNEGNEIPWAGFNSLNKVQQFIFIYGLKQKLADAGSAEKGALEKSKIARKKFDLFVKGELAGERSNSTGAKANKAFVANMKETAKTVSLEGLMVKKLTNAEAFTEDDQAKLDEFISLQAKHLAKEAKAKKDGLK